MPSGPPPPPGGGPADPPSSGGGGGGGSSSGGSSGGSPGGSSGGSSGGGSTSSGSSAPAEPKDPYLAWLDKLSQDDKDTVSQLRSAYVRLWGVGPPLAVLQAAIANGMNVWEFEDAQRRNPAWWKTEAAEDEGREFDLFLEQLGMVPKRKPKKKGGGKNDGKKGGGKGPKPGSRPPGGFPILDDNRRPPGGRRAPDAITDVGFD